MANYRQSIIATIAVLALVWSIVLWLIQPVSPVDPGSVSDFQLRFAAVLNNLNSGIVFLLAILLYPEILAFPFTINRVTGQRPATFSRSRRLLRFYYFVFVVSGATSLCLFWSRNSLALNGTMLDPPLLLAIAIITFSGTLYYVCWRFQYLIMEANVTIWILILVLSAALLFLFVRVDADSLLTLAAIVIAMPSSALLVGLWQFDLRTVRERLILGILCLLPMVTTIVLWTNWRYMWAIYWFVLGILAFVSVLVLAVRRSWRLGYTARLRRRLQVEKPAAMTMPRLQARPDLVWSGILIRIIQPVGRVVVSITNVLILLFTVLANVAVTIILVIYDLVVRVPEVIGSSLIRLRYVFDFYFDTVLMPIVGLVCSGLSLAVWGWLLPTYFISGTTGMGFALMLCLFLFVIGVLLSVAGLFQITIGAAATAYFKNDEPESFYTPQVYLILGVLLLWLVQFIGMGVTTVVFREASPIFAPGAVFSVESVLILIGLAMAIYIFWDQARNGKQS